jgi:hypothetical protein
MKIKLWVAAVAAVGLGAVSVASMAACHPASDFKATAEPGTDLGNRVTAFIPGQPDSQGKFVESHQNVDTFSCSGNKGSCSIIYPVLTSSVTQQYCFNSSGVWPGAVTFKVRSAGGSSTQGAFSVDIHDMVSKDGTVFHIEGDSYAPPGNPEHCYAATKQAGATGRLYFCAG